MATKITNIRGQQSKILIKPSELQFVRGISVDSIGVGVPAAPSVSPIAVFEFVDGSSTVVQLYLYDPNDLPVDSSQLRMSTAAGVGAFYLVDTNDSLSSSMRVATTGGVKSIATNYA